ncbi:MAG: endo-1,4-beta-xylanase [Spirochaetaceae bacterium]
MIKIKNIVTGAILISIIVSCISMNVTNPSGLLTEAKKQNMLIGAAVNPALLDDKTYKSTLLDNFNFITAENVMKWEIIHPSADKYNFEESDKLVDFAVKNSLEIRGHTLVWHFQNPSWLTSQNYTKDELLVILENHIKTVVSRYKGKIKVWDVVNEAIDGSGYRDSIWYKVIGPEYIELAFKWAHEADPDAELIYNDYGIGTVSQKSDLVFDMLNRLRDSGVPITGVGFQQHIDMTYNYDFESLYNNMDRFIKSGYSVAFTEIDIRYKGDVTDKQQDKQARVYKKLMEVMLSFENSNAFTVWGISDAHSWIPGFFTGYDNALLFDKEYGSKPSVISLTETLAKGPVKLPYAMKKNKGSRKIFPSFKALEAETVPLIDGDPTDSVWETGITYPFAYNQLEELDLRLSSEYRDIFGEWVILYSGNTMYGRVKIVDDITETSVENSWENDNIEVFFHLNKEWAQLRTLVGSGFESHKYPGVKKAVWSTDNSSVEFSVEMPIDLAGQLSGWNIALSDNDGGSLRQSQLYATNGINNGWEGKGFGNIQFIGNSPKPPEEPRIVKAFVANITTEKATIDGILDESMWNDGTRYSFIYNQLNPKNQLPNRDYKDISGDWSIMYNSDTIYGYINRIDDIESTDDKVDIAIILNGKTQLYSATIGTDFSNGNDNVTGTWNSDNSVFEFQIKTTTEELKKYFIGFNISLTDDDGSGAEYILYPVPGDNKISNGTELAELHLMK